MTSVLNVDTIADKAGTGPVGLTKQAAIKAYVNSPGTRDSINASLNISSLDDDGTGDYGLNYTNSFADIYYAWAHGVDDGTTTTAVLAQDGTNGTYATGSTDFNVYFLTSTNNRTDADHYGTMMILGDLA
tara:strand:- start:70 stop:459 length:390 start_codon:yes stop_codon:yes gene_type:complete